jgi:predicted RNase H-like HicB family nuclease
LGAGLRRTRRASGSRHVIADDGQKIYRLVSNAFRRRIFTMNSTFTAITKKDGDWWVGWIEEVPGVNAQEETKEELISSLKEILSEALVFNRSEAREAAESDYTEELVTV